MESTEGKTYFCEVCKRTMRADEFYSSNNLEKYPNDGKLHQCKKCLTRHVDNFNPDTYLWILQEIDVPYIPDEWNKLLAKYGKDRNKLTGMTIIGRYLSKMKLKQFRDYRWEDTAFLQELANSKIEIAMKQQGKSASEIASVIQEVSFAVPTGELTQPEIPNYSQEPVEDYFDTLYNITPKTEVDLGLTDEDITYLRLKWGKTYKPEEWVALEQMYEDMMNSYDIQGAGHIDTLKLVCKTSLKANQLIDMGDIEGFQKISKVYDGLMKSGKFTAAQNKAESGDFVDSIGELIELCEKQGYIERFYIDTPNDKVDLTIQDMQRYTRTLIEEETNLSLMVERALRENEKEDIADLENNDEEIIDDTDLSLEELEKMIKDQDYVEFEEFLENETLSDEEFLNGDL